MATCPIKNCGEIIGEEHLMCLRHWRGVGKSYRQRIRHYQRKQLFGRANPIFLSLLMGAIDFVNSQEESKVVHRCHATGCNVQISPFLLMCLKHWNMVPQVMKKRVWLYYRKGQEIDKQPSPEYMRAQQAAIQAVAEKEGKLGPEEPQDLVEAGGGDRPRNRPGSEGAQVPGRSVGGDRALDPARDQANLGEAHRRSDRSGQYRGEV